MHELQEIEDKVLEALGPLKESGARNIETYGGQLDTEKDLEELAGSLDLFPYIGVVAGGLESEGVNLSDEIYTSVILIVADQNSRGPEYALRGDSASPGVYGLLGQIKEKLHRKNVVPGWAQLVRAKEIPVIYKPAQGLCAYMAVYRVFKKA